MTVWFSANGIADQNPGKRLLRNSMRFVSETGLLELFETKREKFTWLDNQ